MNNIIAFSFSSPKDIALQIAARVKSRRLELDETPRGVGSKSSESSCPPIVDSNRLVKSH